ncbi:MAG TPA: DNA topoisomerase IB [Planctomycetia bacterium]|nr:DNA topoisomerase IB [Planctomycetia bacterium]
MQAANAVREIRKRKGAPAHPEESAKAAGLVYVRDREGGYRRVRAGKGFGYRTAEGRTVRDPRTLARLKALVLPPAWTDVWICANPRGHLQATGYDARGRKQYRYHDEWRGVRDETKFYRLAEFGAALPKLRERVDEALSAPGLSRNKVTAAALRMLDLAHVRVGNEAYRKENGSYGLTTLCCRHVTFRGGRLSLRFRGKSGVEHRLELADARLARVVRRCHELPGKTLFQYEDEAGEVNAITSGDVNEALREFAGADFTAKDFRTWAGSVRFLEACAVAEEPDSLVRLVEAVAAQLGNTTAVCRKHYIHPALIAAHGEGTLAEATANLKPPLEREKVERRLLALLRRGLT